MRPGAETPTLSGEAVAEPVVEHRQSEAELRRGSPAAVAVRFGPLLVPYLILAVMIGVQASLQSGTLSLSELNTDSAATLTLLLAATGQTIVILLGGIDLSVGGVISLSTALAATHLAPGGAHMVGWIVLTLFVGGLAGALNGVLMSVLKLQPFIVTLATWSIWSGTALWILPTEGGTIPQSFVSWAQATAAGIATPVWLLLGVVAFWLWFKPTRLAIGIRSIGSSQKSAYLSGVPVAPTMIAAYMLSGIFAAMAGLFLTTQTASGSPTVGNDFILTSVAAVVIGGTSLFGGRGGLGGTFAGAFILTVIANVIFALNVSSFWQPVISGLLLIFAVLVNSALELYARKQALR